MSILSPFPPSLSDGPVSYGLALIGDMLAAGFSLTILFHYLFSPHRAPQKIEHTAAGLLNIKNMRGKVASVRALRRLNDYIVAGLMLAVVFRTVPDVAIMLSWGETTEPVARLLFNIDYVFDFIALLPLGGAAVVWAWARPSISQQLAKADDYPMPPIRLVRISGFLKIAGLVTLIGVGLTLAKAASV